MENLKSNQQVFLFVSHVFSRDIINEFKRIQRATKDFGNSCILYHVKDGVKINQKILDLPHYICTDSSISKVGYPTYSPNNSLRPGSAHFLLIQFYREHVYKNYWFIEYDVRFHGKWRDFFHYFNNCKEDFITSHIRRYEEEAEWIYWSSISHPIEKIQTSELLRSFNPIFRISYPALEYIDNIYQKKWKGHYELTFPTFLQNGGFKIRDFGGNGSFVYSEDKNRFYIDPTSCWMKDGSMRFCDPHLWLFNKPRNKLFHPIKPNEKQRYFKRKINNLVIRFSNLIKKVLSF